MTRLKSYQAQDQRPNLLFEARRYKGSRLQAETKSFSTEKLKYKLIIIIIIGLYIFNRWFKYHAVWL